MGVGEFIFQIVILSLGITLVVHGIARSVSASVERKRRQEEARHLRDHQYHRDRAPCLTPRPFTEYGDWEEVDLEDLKAECWDADIKPEKFTREGGCDQPEWNMEGMNNKMLEGYITL